MLVYALVARGKTVLAEYTSTSGNFPTVTRVLLGKIPTDDHKMSYVYDAHLFHYIVSDGITVLCLTEDSPSRRVPFAFLEDIRAKFRKAYGDRGKTAIAFAMNADFQGVLAKQMEHFNSRSADSISRVQDRISDVKNVMVENIDKVLQRGERIELLVDKAESLKQSANAFQRQSKKLKNAMWWKNVKLMLILALIILTIIYLIVSWACGGLGLPDCVGGSNGGGGSGSTTTQ